MTTFYMGEGGIVPKAVYTDMNTVLNKKLGTSTAYTPDEWADIVKDFAPLPEKTASGTIAHFEDGADDVPLKTARFYFNPVQAAGTPTPSSPIAISGHTGLNIAKAKKNLFDLNIFDVTGITIENGVATGTATSFHQAFRYGVPDLKFSDGQMTLKMSAYTDGNASTSSTGLRVRIFYTDGTNSTLEFLNSDTTKTTKSVTTTAGEVIDYMTITYASTGSNIWHVSEVQLECGTTATAYETYAAPIVYPVSWTSEGTIYGGYYDADTGELWKTHEGVTFNGAADETWAAYGSQNGFTKTITDMKSGSAMQDGCANFLQTIPNYTSFGIRFGGNNNNTLYLCHITDNITGVTDVASWKTYLQNNNLQVVYPLATPVKVATLDPTVIYSFLGVNNIYHDANGNTDLTYRADIELYINQ